MEKLKVAVIGVGYLGRFHAQKYAAMDDVELVGVVDIDPARAALVAAEVGAKAFGSLSEIPVAPGIAAHSIIAGTAAGPNL